MRPRRIPGNGDHVESDFLHPCRGRIAGHHSLRGPGGDRTSPGSAVRSTGGRQRKCIRRIAPRRGGDARGARPGIVVRRSGSLGSARGNRGAPRGRNRQCLRGRRHRRTARVDGADADRARHAGGHLTRRLSDIQLPGRRFRRRVARGALPRRSHRSRSALASSARDEGAARVPGKSRQPHGNLARRRAGRGVHRRLARGLRAGARRSLRPVRSREHEAR